MLPRLSAASLAPPSVAEVLVGVGVGAPRPLVGIAVGVPLVGVGVGVGSLVVLVPLGASILTVSIPGGLCWGISRSGLFFWGLVGHSGSFTNSLGVGLVCGCGVLVGGGLGFPLTGIPLLGLGFLFGFTIVDDVVDCFVEGLVIPGVGMHIRFDCGIDSSHGTIGFFLFHALDDLVFGLFLLEVALSAFVITDCGGF